jgi:hypothetical protein
MIPALVAAYKVDRTGWASGPWDAEPDRVDFRHAKLPCLLLRNNRGGNWCGYVGVPATHPDYGRHYNDVDVECHGGLTYADACDGSRICHVPQPGEPDDAWWFGFDCHHAFDVAPGFDARYDYHIPGQEYRTEAYARRETERLAEQLALRST